MKFMIDDNCDIIPFIASDDLRNIKTYSSVEEAQQGLSFHLEQVMKYHSERIEWHKNQMVKLRKKRKSKWN